MGSTSLYLLSFTALMISVCYDSANGQETLTRVGFRTVPPLRQSRLTLNGQDSVFFNLPSTITPLMIPDASQVIFDGNSVAITGGFNPSSISAGTFQTVIDSDFSQFTGGVVTESGPGTLYSDGTTALFTNNSFVTNNYNLIQQQIPPVLSQVAISTSRSANNELVLNLQPQPENPMPDGDILELTGSRDIMLQAGESLTYAANTLRIRRGSVTQEVIENIESLRFLEDTNNGRALGQFFGMAGMVFSGPGILRTGINPDNRNQMVALFSTSMSGNQEIGEAIVDQQLTFDAVSENSVMISDIFTTPGTPMRLIELFGSRTFNYPTATEVQFDDGMIEIFDAFDQRLASLSGSNLNAFLNNEITSLMRTGGTGNFMVPEGGLTLVTNQDPDGQPGQGETFIYPTQNTVVSQRIQEATGQVSIPSPGSPAFLITPNAADGSAVLSINGVDSVTVTDRDPIPVGIGQSVGYDGSTLMVYSNADPSTGISGTPIDGISQLTTFETPGNFLNTYANNTPLPFDLGGPGVIYVDNDGRAFFTNSQPISTFISGTVEALPPVQILTRPAIINGSRVVRIEAINGRPLVTASTSTTTEVLPEQGVIYLNNMLRTVNGFMVPSSATVRYFSSPVPEERIVEVRSPDNQLLFTTTASSSFAPRMGGMLGSTPAMDTSFSGGGVIYFNPTSGDVVYNEDTSVSPSLVMDLMSSGIMFPSNTGNIEELNFFNGRSLTRFRGAAPDFLSGPGTIFTSGSQSLFSTDVSRNMEILREVSTAMPIQIVVNQTTGVVEIISPGTQTTIFSFTFGSSRSVTFPGTVTYTNGVLRFNGETFNASSVSFFNGVSTERFGPGDTIEIAGGGSITINMMTEEVLITTDPGTINTINNRIMMVQRNFRRPVIFTPDNRVFTTKLNEASPFFGQTVNVFQSTNVDLRCRVSDGVPAPTFQFFRNGTLLDDSESRITISRVSLEEARLRISNVMLSDANLYECRAMNVEGRDRSFSELRVRPPVLPEIVNNFFPVSPSRPGITVTAQNLMPPDVASRSIIIRPQSGIPTSEDFPFVETVNVACKGEGLPQAFIQWERNDVPILPNDTNIFVPRAGRSIYTENITGTQFITYECIATNGAGEANGVVRILPELYSCEDRDNGPCTGSCGFGIQEMIPSACTVERNQVTADIDATDLPVGLFPVIRSICVLPNPCPVITFNFVAGDFSACSVTCGGGVMMRNVSCFEFSDGNQTMMVDDEFCAGITRPPSTMGCGFDGCPRWSTSDFSSCSSTCAGGTQVRNVTCVQFIPELDNETGAVLTDNNDQPIGMDVVQSDDLCDGLQRPSGSRPCNFQIPCPNRWFPGPWGPCDEFFCQTRMINCTQFDPSDPDERWVIPDSECDHLPRLHSVRGCNGGACSRGTFRSVSAAPCSVTCGFGLEPMNVNCFIGSEETEEGFCDPQTRPPDFRQCILFNCPGRCDFEPQNCPAIQAFGCKTFAQFAEPCCKSCPLQSTPITLPPLIEIEDLVIQLEQDSYTIPSGMDAMFCCMASSRTTPNAFLPFLTPCEFQADGIDIMMAREVDVGRRLGNTACVTFETSELAPGSLFELSLFNGNILVDAANVTVT